MTCSRIFFRSLSALALLAVSGRLLALPLDDFNANVSNWQSGAPNEPEWVSTGGNPGGCLLLRSGSGYANKQVMYNTNQWAFNFTAAGVTMISFDARTSYSSALPLRIAIRDVSTSNVAGSLYSATLPNDGLWHNLSISVASADMVAFSGTVAGALSDVGMFRILSNAVPSFSGDPITADVYFDNITALVPTLTPTPTASPTLSPTPSATGTASASPTLSDTGSPTQTGTISPTFSASPTETESPSVSPTFSVTGTPTPTPSATATLSITPSLTASPTATVSPDFSATPTLTASATASPTRSATPLPPPFHSSSGLGHPALGPVPARRDEPLCLYLPAAPLSSRWEVFNSGGQRVATLSFGSELEQCWEHAGVAPGLYYIHWKAVSAAGTQENLQKAVLLP